MMIKILDDREVCDLECIQLGAFAPLQTYMTKQQYTSCLHTMKIDNVVFPIPITLSVPSEPHEDTMIELRSQTGLLHATLTVTEWWPINVEQECQAVFHSTDQNHPYIKYLYTKTDTWYVTGSLTYTKTPFHSTHLQHRLTPEQVCAFQKSAQNDYCANQKSSSPLIAFQTRNPLHRSHIELIRNAAKQFPDARILLHPVEGVTQDCDVPFSVRMKCYQQVLPYLPKNSILSILPLSMRMAGPREAVWHAVIRRNYECTHFIVGRDHAGPSYKTKDNQPFFHPRAAQELAKQLEPELGIHIITSEEVAYNEEQDAYLEISKAPVGTSFQTISGTNFRVMLEKNEPVPKWYSYPEVIQTLQQFYQRPKGACYYFVGLSGSGKSTMAEILKTTLEERYPHRPVTLLDADIIRTHLSKGLGFSKEDRSMNVRRIGYVASEIVKHGGLVVVANIAPYNEDRQYNKKIISQWGEYVQIYVDTPLSICEERDVKGIYKAARAGQMKQVTGIDDPFEVPTDSAITIPHTTLEEATSIMLKALHL